MTQLMPGPRITIITLGVNDVKLSTKFFNEGLGWPMTLVSDEKIPIFQLEGTRMCLYDKKALADDAQMELTKENQSKLTPSEAQQLPYNGITLTHNVNSEKEVDQILDTAVKAGAKLQTPGLKKPWGYAGYFRDPDGYLWEVSCTPVLAS